MKILYRSKFDLYDKPQLVLMLLVYKYVGMFPHAQVLSVPTC